MLGLRVSHGTAKASKKYQVLNKRAPIFPILVTLHSICAVLAPLNLPNVGFNIEETKAVTGLFVYQGFGPTSFIWTVFTEL